MARPPTISSEKRVEIFLEFRRLQKVYPTAKRYDIARSTVSAIVNEFRDAGFASAPRPALSPEMLTLAQQQHLREMVARRGTPPTLSLSEPRSAVRGGLDPKEALDEDAQEKVTRWDPFPLPEELWGHLKGTPAETAIQETRRAVTDYYRRCWTLWKDIRSGLEQECNLKVHAYVGADERPSEPHLFHSLVDVLYRALWSGPLPPTMALDWVTNQEDPTILILLATQVAVGSPKDHKTIKSGTKRFLAENGKPLQEKARELAGLSNDLAYLEEIVSERLGRVTEEDILKGVCPACPYPEGRVSSLCGDVQSAEE